VAKKPKQPEQPSPGAQLVAFRWANATQEEKSAAASAAAKARWAKKKKAAKPKRKA
jgi:hypothetical protein